jgi:lipoprotein-releasing system permease protein
MQDLRDGGRHDRIARHRSGGIVLGFIFLFFRQSVVNFIQFVTGQNLWDPSIRFLTELPSKTDPFE